MRIPIPALVSGDAAGLSVLIHAMQHIEINTQIFLMTALYLPLCYAAADYEDLWLAGIGAGFVVLNICLILFMRHLDNVSLQEHENKLKGERLCRESDYYESMIQYNERSSRVTRRFAGFETCPPDACRHGGKHRA